MGGRNRRGQRPQHRPRRVRYPADRLPYCVSVTRRDRCRHDRSNRGDVGGRRMGNTPRRLHQHSRGRRSCGVCRGRDDNDLRLHSRHHIRIATDIFGLRCRVRRRGRSDGVPCSIHKEYGTLGVRRRRGPDGAGADGYGRDRERYRSVHGYNQGEHLFVGRNSDSCPPSQGTCRRR